MTTIDEARKAYRTQQKADELEREVREAMARTGFVLARNVFYISTKNLPGSAPACGCALGAVFVAKQGRTIGGALRRYYNALHEANQQSVEDGLLASTTARRWTRDRTARADYAAPRLRGMLVNGLKDEELRDLEAGFEGWRTHDTYAPDCLFNDLLPRANKESPFYKLGQRFRDEAVHV